MTSPTNLYRPKGRIDATNAAAAESEVLASLERAGPSVVIDLSQVAYLSSAGLRVLLVAAKSARGRGGKAVVVAPQTAVLEVLKMSGFDKIIPISVSIEAATQLLSA
jgi:anti-anti-sigma factor